MQVGYDLTAGLPGHIGVVTVEALGGDFNLSVLSGQSSYLAAGLYIDLDGEAYEIESVGSLNDTITLVEVRTIAQRNCHQGLPQHNICNFHQRYRLRPSPTLCCIVPEKGVCRTKREIH